MDQRVRKVLIITMLAVTTATVTLAVLFVVFPMLLVHPGGPHEGLCLESSQVSSPTNVTLNVINCGYPYTTTLVSYFVTWQQSVYSNTNWSGPTIAQGARASVNILIDGTAFTFQQLSTYTITITTARNNLFSFQIST